MTTRQLIGIYRGRDRRLMLSSAAEAADRIEYLDERVAILSDGELCGRDYSREGMGPDQLVWMLRASGSAPLIASCASQVAECLEWMEGRVIMLSGGQETGLPPRINTCLTDRADWPG